MTERKPRAPRAPRVRRSANIVFTRVGEHKHDVPGKMAGDAAGYGLYITRSREIEPRRTYKCGAGWSVAIPEGYIGMIVSAGNLQVRTAIIDASNTGEIVLAVTNSRDDIQYIGAFSVFAKLIIIPCLAAGSVAADPSQGFGVDDQ